MEFNLTEDLGYAIDKGVYSQTMAVSNLAFVLYTHINDETDEFLNSEMYERLFEKVVRATAARWYYESEVISMYTQEPIVNYYIDTSLGILKVETK